MDESEEPQHLRFASKVDRMASYATWPKFSTFDREALAHAGLYNNDDGTTDAIQVRCFCCGHDFINLSPEDDFMFQHYKQSQNCKYIRQIFGKERIKEYQEQIQKENPNNREEQETSRDGGQWTAPADTISSLYETLFGQLDTFENVRSLIMPTPQDFADAETSRNGEQRTASARIFSPQYQTYFARLVTFENWSPLIKQTPQDLANAGFYYTGLQDVVRCFACDGGLKNWEAEDHPWIEHARWFPHCPFVKQVKSQAFIDRAQGSMEESDEDEDADSKNTNNLGMITPGVEREEGCDLLTTPAAISLLEFGYNANIVATAINILQNKGHSEPTAVQILDIILGMEEGGEMNCDENASSSTLTWNTIRQQSGSDQTSAEETQHMQQRK